MKTIFTFIFLLGVGCKNSFIHNNIEGKWTSKTNNGKIELNFSNGILTETHIYSDTTYSLKSKFKVSNDTLWLDYGLASELHYIKNLKDGQLMLEPENPNNVDIPAIDIVKFYRNVR